MNEKDVKNISKFLSYILRHKPETIGVNLDAQGWADVDELIAKSEKNGWHFNRELLEIVVASNDKKRFSWSEDGSRIRANQGHSISVELGLAGSEPPAYLYHGTVHEFVASIQENGLLKMQRQHVHLSKDKETAIKVGGRRGKPVILIVRSGQMYSDGFAFYLSDNGVWLTDHVPAQYIEHNDEITERLLKLK